MLKILKQMQSYMDNGTSFIDHFIRLIAVGTTVLVSLIIISLLVAGTAVVVQKLATVYLPLWLGKLRVWFFAYMFRDKDRIKVGSYIYYYNTTSRVLKIVLLVNEKLDGQAHVAEQVVFNQKIG